MRRCPNCFVLDDLQFREDPDFQLPITLQNLSRKLYNSDVAFDSYRNKGDLI